MTEQKQKNALIHEKSPYLLQHAYNPVHWYPWEDEVLERAKKENKLIFLSIGYSACHWCHVMEKESFQDEGIAQLLNGSFISIKVDREQRPDVDQVYMDALIAITGHGGWPLNIFLTPELKPFYGGTYFPIHDSAHQSGFGTILFSIENSWKKDPKGILQAGEELLKQLSTFKKTATNPTELDCEALSENVFLYLSDRYDELYGGFGRAPKFPSGHLLSFLLGYAKRSHCTESQKMAEHTLFAMAKGGMYDHLEGGFHRYSTDEKWHVPHFEKMLYDQAILAKVYSEAFHLTKKKEYLEVAESIYGYSLSRLYDIKGKVFFSAEDADSAVVKSMQKTKKEGAFYVWEYAEIVDELSEQEKEFFVELYGVRKEGNVENDPFNEFKGVNILWQIGDIKEILALYQISFNEFQKELYSAKQKLTHRRNKRFRPDCDQKILTDWNALMISAMAYTAQIVSDRRYYKEAAECADHLQTLMWDAEKNLLMHTERKEGVMIHGFLDDYAFLAKAFFDLYQVSLESKYLRSSKELLDRLLELFWDGEAGGFYFVAQNERQHVLKRQNAYDSVMPSGNSVALDLLVKMGYIYSKSTYHDYVCRYIYRFESEILSNPQSYVESIKAINAFKTGYSYFQFIGHGCDYLSSDLKKYLDAQFDSFKILSKYDVVADLENDFLKELRPSDLVISSIKEGQMKIVFCHGNRCYPTVTSVDGLKKLYTP